MESIDWPEVWQKVVTNQGENLVNEFVTRIRVEVLRSLSD